MFCVFHSVLSIGSEYVCRLVSAATAPLACDYRSVTDSARRRSWERFQGWISDRTANESLSADGLVSFCECFSRPRVRFGIPERCLIVSDFSENAIDRPVLRWKRVCAGVGPSQTQSQPRPFGERGFEIPQASRDATGRSHGLHPSFPNGRDRLTVLTTIRSLREIVFAVERMSS